MSGKPKQPRDFASWFSRLNERGDSAQTILALKAAYDGGIKSALDFRDALEFWLSLPLSERSKAEKEWHYTPKTQEQLDAIAATEAAEREYLESKPPSHQT